MNNRPFKTVDEVLFNDNISYSKFNKRGLDALIRAGTLPTDLAAETFNVACGESTTNKEILRHLLLKNPAAKYHSAPWRSGDVKHTLADISKTEQVLGYKPLVRFWDGLEITSKWYKDNWRLIKEIK